MTNNYIIIIHNKYYHTAHTKEVIVVSTPKQLNTLRIRMENHYTDQLFDSKSSYVDGTNAYSYRPPPDEAWSAAHHQHADPRAMPPSTMSYSNHHHFSAIHPVHSSTTTTPPSSLYHGCGGASQVAPHEQRNRFWNYNIACYQRIYSDNHPQYDGGGHHHHHSSLGYVSGGSATSSHHGYDEPSNSAVDMMHGGADAVDAAVAINGFGAAGQSSSVQHQHHPQFIEMTSIASGHSATTAFHSGAVSSSSAAGSFITK